MDKSRLGNTGGNKSKDFSQSKTLPAATKTVQNTQNGQTALSGQTQQMGQSTMKSNQNQVKKQEKSSEEEIMEKEIQSVEVARLAKVFDQLRTAQTSGKNGSNNSANQSNLNNNSTTFNGQATQQATKKEEKGGQANAQSNSPLESSDYFTAKDVAIILDDLGYPASKAEVDQMIWEVDENLDQKVNSYEFNLMYRRCRHDTTGLEPRNLYNLVQFLMYLKSDPNQSSSSSSSATASYANTKSSNAEQKKTITVEDTLELLYVRYGRQNLDREIEEIFGKDEKNAQGEEKSITLKEYLEKQRKRDFSERKELEAERKKVKMPEENEKSHRY